MKLKELSVGFIPLKKKKKEKEKTRRRKTVADSQVCTTNGQNVSFEFTLMRCYCSWLGCKWTMSLSILAYMPFIASQFYPKFYTMIPAGLSVGLGGGPLWCAKCTYLTVAAEAYSTISDVAADVLVTRFFGLFFMFYQMAQVWGNLISSAGEFLPMR